jgi:hypothetical protein
MAMVDSALDTIHVVKETMVAASAEIVFESILEELGPAGQLPDGTPMMMKIEAWPGGRLWRDLGNNTGHFWGHVQVIKPPKILEICGPMFMSYPVVSHIQYRVTEEGGMCKLVLTHRAFGQIQAEHRDGVEKGWGMKLQKAKEIAERRAKR